MRAEKIITKAKEKALMITAKANEEAEKAMADANIRAERVSSCAIQVHLLSVTPHNKS
jgi:vacuolar-type H+-ATPase subunit H